MSNNETIKMNNICLQGAHSLMVYYLRRHEYSLLSDKISAVFFSFFFFQSLSMLDIQWVTTKKRNQHWISIVNMPITALITCCPVLSINFLMSPTQYTHYWKQPSWQLLSRNFPDQNVSINISEKHWLFPNSSSSQSYLPIDVCNFKQISSNHQFSLYLKN